MDTDTGRLAMTTCLRNPPEVMQILEWGGLDEARQAAAMLFDVRLRADVPRTSLPDLRRRRPVSMSAGRRPHGAAAAGRPRIRAAPLRI